MEFCCHYDFRSHCPDFFLGGLQGLLLTPALCRLRKHNTALAYLTWLIGILSLDTLSQLLFWNDLPNMAQSQIGKEKYGGLSLEKRTQTAIWQQLDQLFLAERLYTNPELRISDLADPIGLLQHLVSHVINDCRAQNFNELVNELQTEECKRLLRLESSLSVHRR